MKRIIGTSGSALVILGVFLPAVTVPLIGGIPLFFNGGGIGGVILCGAIAAFILYAINWYEAGNVVGLMTAAPIFLTVAKLSQGMAKLGVGGLDQMLGGNAPVSVSSITSQAVLTGGGLSYAWALLVPGALMISLAAFAPDERHQRPT